MATMPDIARMVARRLTASADVSMRVQQFVDSHRTEAEADRSREELRRVYLAYRSARARRQPR